MMFSIIFSRGMVKKSQDIGNLLLEKQDFSRCAFPNDWDKLLGSLGDRGKVDFPIEACLFISRSPKNHTVSKEKQ